MENRVRITGALRSSWPFQGIAAPLALLAATAPAGLAPVAGFARRIGLAPAARLALLTGLALLAGAGCAGAAGPALPEPERPPPAGAVRVRLAFAAEVDLDLYVTGPSQETVYFANPHAADGGALDADRRCESAGPRIETVLFPEARPGRYRIGLDFPERCRGGVERADYALEWQAPGQAPERLRGEIDFGRLEVRVVEFEVAEDPR